jgi:hypothetical protein
MGAVTFGSILIMLGGVFLLDVVLPQIDMRIVVQFWPVALIMLGIEVLLGNRRKVYEVVGDDGRVMEQCKVIYDIVAIVMMFCILLFTMVLAWVDGNYMNDLHFFNL